MIEFSGVDNKTNVASPTESLVERATLKKEEVLPWGGCKAHGFIWTRECGCDDEEPIYHKEVADAARDKALRAVVDWLRDEVAGLGDIRPGQSVPYGWKEAMDHMRGTIERELEAAGLERTE
ncbi:hypothetical protein LCGC14_2577450 [marine sediment metagenome]|uniref:Uncharacterized protein n=1 Tax=marine sediment metagenome TaxID=412755 RepID=A0A0F9CRL0_9ZZZZ